MTLVLQELPSASSLHLDKEDNPTDSPRGSIQEQHERALMMVCDALHNSTGCYFINTDEKNVNGRAEAVWSDSHSGTVAARWMRNRQMSRFNSRLSWFFLCMSILDNWQDHYWFAVALQCVELAVLAYFIAFFLASMFFMFPRRSLWFKEGIDRTGSATEPKMVLLMLICILFDVMCWCFWMDRRFNQPPTRSVLNNNGVSNMYASPVRHIGSMMRAVYCIYFNNPMRQAFRSLVLVLPSVVPVLAITACSFCFHFLIIQSVVPGNLASDKQADRAEEYLQGENKVSESLTAPIWHFCPAGQPDEALWNLFIYWTTANHPDMFMPLYHTQTFAGFISMSFMLFTNLVSPRPPITYTRVVLEVVASGVSQSTSRDRDERVQCGHRGE